MVLCGVQAAEHMIELVAVSRGEYVAHQGTFA